MGLGIQSGAAGLAAGAARVHRLQAGAADGLDSAVAFLRRSAEVGMPVVVYGTPAGAVPRPRLAEAFGVPPGCISTRAPVACPGRHWPARSYGRLTRPCVDAGRRPVRDARTVAGAQVVRLPIILRGRSEMPPWPGPADIHRAITGGGRWTDGSGAEVHGPTDDGCYVITRPVIDRDSLTVTGQAQVLVLAAPDPRSLLEPDPAAVRELMGLSTAEVMAFVSAVGEALRGRAEEAAATGALLASTSQVADRAHQAFQAQLAGLFDGEAVGRMIDSELGLPGTVGRRYLDDWPEQPVRAVRGLTERLASRDGELPGPPAPPPAVRAVPTRQLHLTAGNAPVVPVVSLLWAWASRGPVW
ncbi:hypothetical protein [Actinomadura sp. 6N118]|uniref:hypothetical protein n=1 Tax=Actinomadura sp. 6N118 TaxID=3375151 RepID=UPI0037A49480